MSKNQKQIMALVVIPVLAATVLLLTGLSEAVKPDKPDPCEPIMTSLEEIHSKLDVIDEKVSPIKCDGTLSEGGRWCDNLDGTIKDMTTGLIWLQDAFCMRTTWYDAIKAVAEDLRSGDCGLTDGSIWGDWRLPTANELYGITQGDEPVQSATPQLFGSIDSSYYWTNTTHGQPDMAYRVGMATGGHLSAQPKDIDPFRVLPVRNGN